MATYPPNLEAYVQQKIASGEFHSRDELAVEAVRMYREMEARRAGLRAGIDQADRGLIEPLDIAAIKGESEELDSRGQPK